MTHEERLAALGLELPPAPEPLGLYRPVLVEGGLAYLSGHGPVQPDGTLVTGRLGDGLDAGAGHAAARLVGLAMLASLRAHLGSLDRVGRLVKTLGMVNSTADFTAQPAVINGCSELFRDVFGDEAGVAARSAIGVNTLPGGIAVEIEAVFTVV